MSEVKTLADHVSSHAWSNPERQSELKQHLGVENAAQLSQVIQDNLVKPSTEFFAGQNGRYVFYCQDIALTVIENTQYPDKSTCFPNERGKDRFDGEKKSYLSGEKDSFTRRPDLHKHGEPKVMKGGYEARQKLDLDKNQQQTQTGEKAPTPQKAVSVPERTEVKPPAQQQPQSPSRAEKAKEKTPESAKEREAAFKEKDNRLQQKIENAPDAKTEERLQMEQKLERAEFSAANKEERLDQARAAPKQDLKEITVAKKQSMDAEKEAKALNNEWHARSVRDPSYKPRDAESAKKVEKARKHEEKEQNRLQEKSKSEKWSDKKHASESKKLQQKLDQKLAKDFNLQSSMGKSMGGMGM
jgi:hypothetical protein